MRIAKILIFIMLISIISCREMFDPTAMFEDDDDSSEASISTESGDFVTGKLAQIVNELPRKETDAFIIPEDCDTSESTRLLFVSLIDYIMAENIESAISVAISLNYHLIKYTDTANKDIIYYLLIEKDDDKKNLGFFAFNPAGTSNLIVEAPHPVYELDSATVAGEIFRQSDAKALFVSGTHRCANSQSSSCSGTTSVCGQDEAFKISDSAHYTCNFFQTAHIAFNTLENPPLFIQIHGFSKDDNEPDIILSDGVEHYATADTNIITLRDKLIETLPDKSVISCQEIITEYSIENLCAYTNVQGRTTNMSLDPCNQNALYSSDRFIHIELSLELRKSPSSVISAIVNTF